VIEKEGMDTERLIEDLAGTLQPVRRLRPPLQRAALWLLVVFVIGGLAVLQFANLRSFGHRMAVTRTAVDCAATALTGIAAVIAAFMLSVPDRSPRWAWLPLPTFIVWLLASGLGCLQNGLSLYTDGRFIGHSNHCVIFILGVSVPLSALLFAVLRRARPINPRPVAALGALGVAALAAFFLQFFHPFDVTVVDLTLHLAAVGTVILVAMALRRPLLARG
jgi:hypothetical protein